MASDLEVAFPRRGLCLARRPRVAEALAEAQALA
jgi:hypothetical protein